MVRQFSFFHVDIKIVPFSDSAEDICLDVYLILLMVEHVKTQTWHITIHAINNVTVSLRFVLVYILHNKNSM